MLSEIAFNEEKLDDSLIVEIETLLAAQMEEVGTKGCRLDVDWNKYLMLNEAGVLRVYAMRVVHKLVGYSSFVIDNHLHHRHLVAAQNDSIYIMPEYRKSSSEFIDFCDARLAEEGVNDITISVKPVRDFSAMLLKKGYEQEETVFLKRI